MRTKRFENYEQGTGVLLSVEEVPFCESDYLTEIACLESKVTPRRVREAIGGDAYAISFINAIDSEIESLRAEMNSIDSM